MIAQASHVDQLLAQREGDEPLDHGGAHLGRDAPGRLIYGHVWGVVIDGRLIYDYDAWLRRMF